MTASNLRAALTAVFLGTATMGVAALGLAVPAAALTVSAKVGPLLNEAKALMTSGNYSAAMSKLREADSVKSTADDTAAINSMRQYIGVKTGDASLGGSAGALAKFANDYNAGRWRDVIADADLLRKYNALTAGNMLIIAQAYYKANDFVGCSRYIKTNLSGSSETALELQARCSYENGDEVTQRQSLESLVARSGKPEHWKGLLRLAERSRGLSDANTLDINRIRMMTGNIVTKDDYLLLAQLALQLGNAAESQSVVEKGIVAKLLNDERSTRLLNLAKTQAAANTANLDKNIAAAQAQPQGDALIKVGEGMVGMGKAKEAIDVILQGNKKPQKVAVNGQMRLGYAQLSAGLKADAQKTFNAIKAPEKDAMVAHLWSLAARR